MTNKKTVKHGLFTFRPTYDQWINEGLVSLNWGQALPWNTWMKDYIVVTEDGTHLHVAFNLEEKYIGMDSQYFRKLLIEALNSTIAVNNINTRVACNMKWSETDDVYFRYVCKNYDEEDAEEDGKMKLWDVTFPQPDLVRYRNEYITFNNGKIKFQLLDFKDYCKEIWDLLTEDCVLTPDGTYTLTFNTMKALEEYAFINILKKRFIYRGNKSLRDSALEQTCFCYAIQNIGLVKALNEIPI